MVTRDGATTCPGRLGVIYDRTTLVRVVGSANVTWTREYARDFSLKSADVRAVTGRSIDDARIIESARHAALIKGSASSYPSINRLTARQKFHRLSWPPVVRQRGQHRVRAGQIAGAGEAAGISDNTEEIVAVAGDRSIHIRSGSRGAGCVAEAVRRGIAGNDRVFQSHASGAHANAAARTFRHELGWFVRATLIDAGVAGLRVVTADRSVFDIYRGRIVVSDSPAVREAALAVSATIKTAVRLSAIAPVTADGEIVGKGRGIDD